MTTRDEFLEMLWNDVINPPADDAWIDRVIQSSERDRNEPFADAGQALKRLRELGASYENIAHIMRSASYEAVFDVLYALDDPGIDNDDHEGLFESLLTSGASLTRDKARIFVRFHAFLGSPALRSRDTGRGGASTARYGEHHTHNVALRSRF